MVAQAKRRIFQNKFVFLLVEVARFHDTKIIKKAPYFPPISSSVRPPFLLSSPLGLIKEPDRCRTLGFLIKQHEEADRHGTPDCPASREGGSFDNGKSAGAS